MQYNTQTHKHRTHSAKAQITQHRARARMTATMAHQKTTTATHTQTHRATISLATCVTGWPEVEAQTAIEHSG